MPSLKPTKSKQKMSSTNRLESLLEETELELEQLGPQIEKLEKQVDKLKQLRLEKQKLITLKLSIQSILQNYSKDEVALEDDTVLDSYIYQPQMTSSVFPPSAQHWPQGTPYFSVNPQAPLRLPGTFIPDMAFQQVNQVLRKRNSLNYELFRAIVFNGGQASTEEIKAYLVEHNILQPASGVGFDEVALTDISSRVNYLVRKGLVNPDGRGNFVSCLGWLVENGSSEHPKTVAEAVNADPL